MTHHTRFTKAFKDFSKMLGHYSRSKMQTKEMCDDAIADTFCKAWVYIKKGGNVRVMKSFLYHLLRHHIVDEYRRKKTMSLDSLMENGFEVKEDHYNEDIDRLEAKRAYDLIDTLPPKYRKVLRLRFEKSLSINEIAAKTLQSKNTVIVQIQRGLKKLRVMMR